MEAGSQNAKCSIVSFFPFFLVCSSNCICCSIEIVQTKLYSCASQIISCFHPFIWIFTCFFYVLHLLILFYIIIFFFTFKKPAATDETTPRNQQSNNNYSFISVKVKRLASSLDIRRKSSFTSSLDLRSSSAMIVRRKNMNFSVARHGDLCPNLGITICLNTIQDKAY